MAEIDLLCFYPDYPEPGNRRPAVCQDGDHAKLDFVKHRGIFGDGGLVIAASLDSLYEDGGEWYPNAAGTLWRIW